MTGMRIVPRESSPVAIVKRFSLLAPSKKFVLWFGLSLHNLRTESTRDRCFSDSPGFDWTAYKKSAGQDAWNHGSGDVKSIFISWRTIRGKELWKITKAESRRKT